VRLLNDPITFAIVPQMASARSVSDDQDISLRSLRRSVQQLRDIAAIDGDFGLRAHILLKLGDHFGGEADDILLPNKVDVGSTGAVGLHAGRDVDQWFALRSKQQRGTEDGPHWGKR